jgi:hypothetical protein
MDLEHGIPLGTGIAILGMAFGAWAWVVAWGVSVIRREVGELKMDVAAARRDAHEAKIEVEHRLTAVESDIRRCVVFNGREG